MATMARYRLLGETHCRLAGAETCLAIVLVVLGCASLANCEDTIGEESPSSNPMYLTACAGLVYFSADDGVHGRELWSVDAMNQCVIVHDLEPGDRGSSPEFLMDVGEGYLFFRANTEEFGTEPYVYLRSENVPRLVGDLRPGPEASDAVPLARSTRNCYFHASVTSASRTVFALPHGEKKPFPLWRPLSPEFLFATLLSGESLIIASGKSLLRADGRPSGTIEISPGPPKPVAPFDHLVSLGTRAIFRAHMPDIGMELWTTDGTLANTGLVCDIWPGASSAEIGPFSVINGEAWFQANDGIHGIELWKTDGTPEGTFMVKDLCPGFAGSDPHYFVQANGSVFFCANDGEHGIELWVSDGTAEGTRMVVDLYPGSSSGEPWSLCEYLSRCYFCANSPDFGEEVFLSDGTPDGTKLLADIVPGPASSGPDSLTNLDDQFLFFTCNDGIHGEELWSSDGSGSGTALVADIWPHRLAPARSSKPHDLVSLDDGVLFAARDMEHGDEVWFSDSTSGNTNLLRDINTGTADSRPRALTRLGPHVLFSAESAEFGRELWCFNGMSKTAVMLQDIRPGPANSNPRDFLVWNDEILFRADGDAGDPELWCSKATKDSTVRLGVPRLSSAVWTIGDPFALLGSAYMYATDPSGAHRLLEVAGEFDRHSMSASLTSMQTGAGQAPPFVDISDSAFARLVTRIRSPFDIPESRHRIQLGAFEYFAAYSTDAGSELWKTDGTPEGTGLIVDCYPGPASAGPIMLATHEGRFLFSAEHPQYGRVLWHSDGTKEGTYVVLPVDSSGHSGSAVVASEAVIVDDRILVAGYFADGSGTARKLIMLRGTAQENVTRHGFASKPLEGVRNLTILGDQVYFVADDGTTGSELWKLDLEANRTRLVRDILP